MYAAAMRRLLSVLLLPALLGGCLAKTALDVVTLPVKAAGAAVDAVTTSQSEADEKRGRELRKREEREGREARKREKLERERARREAAENPGRDD